MWLALLAVVLVVCLLLYLDTLKPRNFPPGPRWLPIVGSALEVAKVRETTDGYLYRAVDVLSRRYCKNGAIIGLRIGKDKIVMINSLEINKEMFTNEDIEGRPKGIFYQARTWGQRRGVLLTDGELWKEQRRFLLKHLKEFGFGRRGMGDIAQHEAVCMVNDVQKILKTKQPPVVYMHNFFNTYVLNTLWYMMAGIRYDPTEPQMILLQDLLYDLFSAIDMVGTAFSHFPILCVLAPTKSGFKNFMRTHQRIWKFLREEISRHKEDFDPEKEDKDFMDVYLRVLKERGEVDTYSEDQLVAVCMDMFMAGTETTNKSMSFGFSYMVRDPSIQRKAQEEIDRVVGRDRAPTLDDRDKMPYCSGIVYESVRHFMARTFSVPHRAMRDTSLAGYHIPEHCIFILTPLSRNRCIEPLMSKQCSIQDTGIMLKHSLIGVCIIGIITGLLIVTAVLKKSRSIVTISLYFLLLTTILLPVPNIVGVSLIGSCKNKKSDYVTCGIFTAIYALLFIHFITVVKTYRSKMDVLEAEL